MTNAKVLKTRLKSVKSTKKITSAMKLVASIKFRKADAKQAISKSGVEKMLQQTKNILSNLDMTLKLPDYIEPSRSIKAELLIVYSSTKGMCGGFNVNVSRYLSERIKKSLESGVKINCICIGQRIKYSLYKLLPKESVEVIDNLDEKDAIEFFKKLSDRIFNEFVLDKYQKVTLVYNRFESAVKILVDSKQILPLFENCSGRVCKKITDFGEDIDTSLSALAKTNLSIMLHHAFLESLASEYSSRMMAMDAANKNADEMIKNLSLEYNQTRQSAITNELVEIISGAEAI